MKAKEVKDFFNQLSADEKAEFFQLICQEVGCLPMMEQMPKMMSQLLGQCCQVKPQDKAN